MQKLIKKQPGEVTVGLPRAFLYYRYDILWKSFFKELGIKTISSPPTNRKMLENGSALAVDESCLSAKLYFGHVNALLDQCDYILVPRVVGFGVHRMMCTRFQSLYDLVVNIFPEYKDKFLVWNVDPKHGSDQLHAFEELGEKLGVSRKLSKKAYQKARKTADEFWKEKVKKQYATAKQKGRKVLVIGHSYVLEDAYVGRHIFDYLEKQEIRVLRADIVNREEALKKSQAVSPTLKWEISQEMVGGIEKYRNQVDGILLVSVYPCGPDSLVNELIVQKYSDLPILQLVLDEQDGTAGIETRMESFLDIIDFKKKVANG